MSLRTDADIIVKKSIAAVLPDEAVRKSITSLIEKNPDFNSKKIHLVAIGKAAYQMANSASMILGDRVCDGIVITKYGHVNGRITNVTCYEAGHPIPDENTYSASSKVIELAESLTADDIVLFLVSGGGSALFEMPLISTDEMAYISQELLACGASITEINTIRKRLSSVKGGKFAQLCYPAHIYSIILSDIIGDPIDMIASGPAYPDQSTCKDALNIIEKYHLSLSKQAVDCIQTETPKIINNVDTIITGSVKHLCAACANICEDLGYKATILTDHLDCEAQEAGKYLSSIAKQYAKSPNTPLAFIAGGETVVHIKGSGKGGRNQELALSACAAISGLDNLAIFSFGSDGTDGPTDAAGGYVDANTYEEIKQKSKSVEDYLDDNDSYNALSISGGLIFTGPTGTNVNDVAVALIS